MGREVIKVIRSNRRTISLEITPAGDVRVCAPRLMLRMHGTSDDK